MGMAAKRTAMTDFLRLIDIVRADQDTLKFWLKALALETVNFEGVTSTFFKRLSKWRIIRHMRAKLIAHQAELVGMVRGYRRGLVMGANNLAATTLMFLRMAGSDYDKDYASIVKAAKDIQVYVTKPVEPKTDKDESKKKKVLEFGIDLLPEPELKNKMEPDITWIDGFNKLLEALRKQVVAFSINVLNMDIKV